MSMLDVEGLHVRYGDTVAVDGVDLRVDEGEVVTLLGPSGCGKSTILRAIAGLVTLDAGAVRFDGANVVTTPPHRRPFGLMFQDYALFPHRDVAGNVAFGPRMRRLDRAAVRTRVDEVLELVGLSGYGRRSVASLSGGEQQRVALARALAPEPRLLMLDEPLGSLDRTLRERLTVELRDLFVRLGITAITVTHDQAEAFTLADRVVVLRDGRVRQVGQPVDVWRAPADAFVAGFLGFGNVFDVEVRRRSIDSPWGPIGCDRADGPATLVIRPDGLRLGADGIAGTARAATFRGDHFLVAVQLDCGWLIEVTERSGSIPPPGAPVAVSLDLTASVVVDR
ncbi:MAG: thiamine transport system ATP-binding protein [Acidimicrobiaceae bacterium]|jgi:thiamine transport system ATP-binding protein